MRCFYFILLCFFSVIAHAQGGFRSRIYEPIGLQHATKDIFETTPNNYIGAGISVELQNGVHCNRLILCGLNNTGQVQWLKKYGTKNLEYLENNFGVRSFMKLGNFIYAAYAMRDSNQKIIGTLVKFDFNGNQVWQKFYRDSLYELVPQMLCQSTDGGFLITGYYQNSSASPCMLIKTDVLGNELWQKKIHKPVPNVSEGRGIAQDSATKKIVIVGYQYVGNASSWLPYDHLVVVDSLGNVISRTHTFLGVNSDLIKCKDGKFALTGIMNDGGWTPYYWSYIKKFDINNPGSFIWRHNFYGPMSAKAGFKCLIELTNGDLIIGGYLNSNADTMIYNLQARILRINPAGNIKWEKLYNYTFNPNANNYQDYTSINTTSDGGWVTSFRCSNFGNNPLFYVKYDSTGCDTTMAYCLNTVGLDEVYNKTGFSLEMFPNPATALVHFKLNAPPKTNFTIKIQSVSGQEIERFSLNAQNDLQLNTSNYATGLYFVEVLQEGKAIETKKLLIVR